MAKETKKPVKGAKASASKASNAVKAGKPAAKPAAAKSAVAKAPAVKAPAKKAAPAKAVVAKAGSSSAKPVSKASPKAAAKPAAKTASKPASAKSAPAKAASKPAAKASAASKTGSVGASSEKKTSSKTATGIAAGVAAVGVAAIGIAASKATKNTDKGNQSPERVSTMPKKEEANGQSKSNQNNESAHVHTASQAAHGNVPAMKLSVNDAEILATATERYDNKELEYFRKLILEQRAEASEEFDIISEQMLDTSGEFDADNQAYSLHTAEQGTDAMEREKTFLHAQRTSDYIKKLDEALARIDRGTYGICVICGKLIQKERLGAVPITQKHVDCKNKTQAKKLSVDQVFREFPDEPAVD